MTDLSPIVDYLLDLSGWPRRDVWLAQLVVGWVEERAKRAAQATGNVEPFLKKALRDFNLDEERFAELKRRLEK